MKKRIEVRLLPQAEEDLLEILEYVALDNVSASEKLANLFEKSFSLLEEYPLSGRLIREARLRVLQYRFLIMGRYLIFYLFRNNKVIVCRILHGARDYMSIL